MRAFLVDALWLFAGFWLGAGWRFLSESRELARLDAKLPSVRSSGRNG